jgi:hypothetical protein
MSLFAAQSGVPSHSMRTDPVTGQVAADVHVDGAFALSGVTQQVCPAVHVRFFPASPTRLKGQ